MRIRSVAAAILVISSLVTIIGCGSQAPLQPKPADPPVVQPPPPPPPPPLPPPSKQPAAAFVYVSVGSWQQPLLLAGFAIDAMSGLPHPTSPAVAFAGGAGDGSLYTMGADPQGQFLFATTTSYPIGSPDTGGIDVGSDELFVFRIDPVTGILSLALGSPMQLGAFNVGRVYISPDGRFVYLLEAPSADRNAIHVYNLDRASGALREVAGSPLLFDGIVPGEARSIGELGITPDGRFMYAEQGDTITNPPSPERFNIYTLALDPISGLPAKTGAMVTLNVGGHLTFTTDSKYLYLGAMAALAINSDGSLTQVAASLNTFGPGVDQLLVESQGRFAFVSPDFKYAGQTYVFNIEDTGALVPAPGSPFNTLNWGGGLTTDAAGRVLYMPAIQNQTDILLVGYSIDPTTGALAPLPGTPGNLTSTGALRSVLVTVPQ